MFEINTNYNEHFDYLLENRIAYKGGVYDFTFEDEYIVYHVEQRNRIEYIAVSLKTHLSSSVTSEPIGNNYIKENYYQMIPKLLKSIKYTGDKRYLGEITHCEEDPHNLIDSIFYDILPRYGYSVRKEQIELCKQMYDGFTSKKVSICEAEVGTGKTLAYLIASLFANQYYKAKYDEQYPITIVTSSIELQKALVEKEIPRLSSILLAHHYINRPIEVALRKGKEHYFCLKRYEELIDNLLMYPMKYWKTIQYLKSIKELPLGVDLDKYEINARIKDRICVKNNCGRCERRRECRYHQMNLMYDRNSKLDFQVANHNLFLMNQRLKDDDVPALLRHSNFITIDEAHKLKDVALDVLGESLSSHTISRYITNMKFLCEDRKKIALYNSKLSKLRETSCRLFKYLKNRIDAQLEDDEQNPIITMDDVMLNELTTMIGLIRQIEILKRKDHSEVFGKVLVKSIDRMMKYTENITWYEIDENDVITLKTVPKDIGFKLHKLVWSKNANYVLTSGTMSDGVNFEFFKSNNGINFTPKRSIIETSFESPFDYEENARLYIPNDIPEPNNDDVVYLGAVASKCLELINLSNGHAVVLFTSYKALHSVYEMIREKLQNRDVFCMTRGSNKTAITQFRKSKNGVLFASGSMWEGVDCAGDILSNLIIVRLPFPMRNAVMEEHKAECDDVPTFIEKYCIPSMLIKLRQGVGRLIRSESDTGIVTILDARAAKGGKYRHNVLNALSLYPLIECEAEFYDFLKERKPEVYWKSNLKEN